MSIDQSKLQAFLLGIVNDTDWRVTKEIFADWLGEYGDEREEIVRALNVDPYGIDSTGNIVWYVHRDRNSPLSPVLSRDKSLVEKECKRRILALFADAVFYRHIEHQFKPGDAHTTIRRTLVAMEPCLITSGFLMWIKFDLDIDNHTHTVTWSQTFHAPDLIPPNGWKMPEAQEISHAPATAARPES